MEMTDGVAAGISLYEENPAPGVFRWQYLRGALARFNGATTPRNFSPCGITLDRMTPILTSHSERMYDWISHENIVVPEVLLVPLYVARTKPLGTLWIVSDDEEHFDSGHARVVTELATFVGIALKMLQTEQRLKVALEETEILAREMSHRVKNAFALIDGHDPDQQKGRVDARGNGRRVVGQCQSALNRDPESAFKRDPDE
jgi:GAF domain-containing protein